jgi:hypothetical protein
LDEFSPIWRLFSLGVIFKTSQVLSTVKVRHKFCQNILLGYTPGEYFTNSSGHPAGHFQNGCSGIYVPRQVVKHDKCDCNGAGIHPSFKNTLPLCRRGFSPGRPGVDVMITIFSDFCQFSAQTLPFFLKKQCNDQLFAKICSNLSKNTFFGQTF